MDKTLEIVVAAAIVIAIGAIAAYLVNDEASSFSGWVGEETQESECRLERSQYESAVCRDPDRAQEIQSNAPEECTPGEWPDDESLCN